MASTHLNKNKWTNWRNENYRFFAERLLHLPIDLVLVDLGSGQEQFRDITRRFKCTSIDFKQYGTTDIVADLTQKIPLQDNSVDIVFTSNTLEHLPNGLEFLQECNRILKPQGMLIGTVPFMVHLHQPPYDYHRYTCYMLEKLLQQSNFQVKEILSLNKPVHLYMGIQDKFFVYLNKSLNKPWERMLAKFARFLSRFLLFLFYPIYLKGEASLNFTQGYGFTAFKNGRN